MYYLKRLLTKIVNSHKVKQLLKYLKKLLQLILIGELLAIGLLVTIPTWEVTVQLNYNNPILLANQVQAHGFPYMNLDTSQAVDNRRVEPQEEVVPTASSSVGHKGTIREVTMYNAGVVWQTDDSPCIAANGENVCLALELGYKRCAANFVPFGTRLRIEGYGECLVTDRMNSRYKNRVDIAAKANEIPRARAFGLQHLKVEIVK